MAKVEVNTQRDMPVEPQQAMEAVADYEQARRRAMPENYSDYRVLEGGHGEGTVVAWKLAATKKRIRDCEVDVSAPQQGELVERDRNSSMVTTWRVQPSGSGSTVFVHTEWTGAGGIGGFFERTFAPAGLRRIHDQTLANLESQLS